MSAKMKVYHTNGHGKELTTCGEHERKGMVYVDTTGRCGETRGVGAEADGSLGVIKGDHSQMVQRTEHRN